MATKIRLARAGAKKRPYYRVVIADARAPRDGDFIEKVGIYDPLLARDDNGRIKLNTDRIAYWLSQGAEPTERVARFIQHSGMDVPAATQKLIAKYQIHGPAKPKKKDQAQA